ncbi:MAG: PHP domain-containing protein [Clostridiales bacterium]|jgi:PHP family Zn ribbon phosphoesterase|nr:PHP domain-containing protein [Clostridiales bacterium]
MHLYYDFHIHTGLSPCGDADMTPNNIVNMALIKELDAIAITDHNTCGNADAVMAVARDTEGAPLVLPGMEVESAEETHIICLFPDLKAAKTFETVVQDSLPNLKNRKEIFGNQYFFDEDDNIVGEEERLLLTASGLDIYTIVNTVKQLGGIAYPAHIDRSSYSVLSSLGFIPGDLDINIVEISKASDPAVYIEKNSRLIKPDCDFVQSSDAHYLENISERERFIELNTPLSAENVINALRAL